MKLHLASSKKCVNIQLYILYKEELSHRPIGIVLMSQILNQLTWLELACY